jgi:hypothetical protein
VARKEIKPWDRQRNEPEAAFLRFTVYRSLGPARSLQAAYERFLEDSGGASKGTKRHRVPGQWRRDCAAHDWVSRARAWDIESFAELGQAAVVGYVALMEKAILKSLVRLDRLDGPDDWGKLLETLHGLSQIIPQSSLAALSRASADRSGGRLAG